MSDHSHPNPKAAPGSHHQSQPEQPQIPPTSQEWVTLGHVVAPFGVRGDLKVFPQTDIPNRFAQIEEIYLGPQHLPYRIASVRPYKGTMLLLHLAGIENGKQAEELRGQALDIPLACIAPLPPDQYYIHDLLGLRVETPGGQMLGVIKDILPTGGHDVYVVQEQGSRREVLVPAVKEMVKRIDITAGVLILDPIPGLFDERFEEAH
jgi:16S rRNA processing protein RimM